jgi:uncharacterized protein (TIGR03435 family)
MKKMASLSLLAIAAALAQQPKFEIADVHASTTKRGYVQNFGGVLRDGKYINRDATMLNLIEAAYGVTEDVIAGGPNWVDLDLFDVIAKVPAGTTPETANLMLQALLEDRFGLVVRKEMHPAPRYVLSVGKSGPKLKAAAASGDSGCKSQLTGAGANLQPNDPAFAPNIKVTCHNLTAKAIADNLHQMASAYLTHDVVDQTKLEGSWDFELEWTPYQLLSHKGHDGISIFDAVNKQLGLQLELKDVPAPSLAIVEVHRTPAANPAGLANSLALAAARFEVAAIKPAKPGDPRMTGILYTGGSEMRAGGTLRQLIAMSMQVQLGLADDILIGLPKSADSEHWVITAKLSTTGEGAPYTVGGRPKPPPLSVALEMLRGLLVDQFELKTHTENREVTVYALTVAGSKPKMTQADDSERSSCRFDPNAPKPFPNVGMIDRCKNRSMDEFAKDLEMANGYIDHPVVNATGLQGGWDFLLGWTPTSQLHTPKVPDPNQPAGPNQAGPTAEATAPLDISVFEALPQELGLKLVKEKRSIPVIIVDHVDEKPIE